MIMESLLWFLLPIAAWSGWQISQKTQQKHKSNRLPANFDAARYYKGVNFLLNDQPDKALGVFIEMLDVNSETVELHLALGHLFRQQGEVERSIRLHQNLLARPTLSDDLMDQVRLELGKDYLKAGLLDRAEEVFKGFKAKSSFKQEAMLLLQDLYERERDWNSAIHIGQLLRKNSNKDLSVPVSHYHCELAEQAFDNKNYDESRVWAKKALVVNKRSVRASIQLAKLAAYKEQYRKAISLLLQVPKQDERFTSEIMFPLMEYYTAIEQGKNSHRRYVGRVLDLVRPPTFRGSSGGIEKGASLINMNENVSLLGVKQYLSLLASQNDEANSALLMKVHKLIEQVTNHIGSYRCEQCGFSGNQLHWQCPSCRHWQSIIPV